LADARIVITDPAIPAPQLCGCGCGQPTTATYRHQNTTRGEAKGQPTRFIRGHNINFVSRPLSIEEIEACRRQAASRQVARNHPETTYAYLAGVLDADGSIFIARQPPQVQDFRSGERFSVRAAVAQTNRAAIDLFLEVFGGKVYERQPSGKTTFRGRQAMYSWIANAQAAADCIEIVTPYLRIKAPEAELARQFFELMPIGAIRHGRRIPDEIIAVRRELWVRMRSLHQAKGKGHPGSQHRLMGAPR
jgi:hypothetical protein